MVSSFIQAIILITDSYLISRHSTIEFDAVGNGGLIYVTMFMALAGMGDGAQILIARRIGQNRFDSIGRIFGTSILTHLVIASILFIIMQFIMPGMLDWYSKHKDLSVLQGKFIRIRSFALFFAMITLSIQALFIAKGRTWIVLASAIISAVSNYLFGKGLIFGNSIFPEMGLEGAALASTIADGISMLFLIVMLLVSKEKADYAA
jgi:Na+-driven multidrug efflux pump